MSVPAGQIGYWLANLPGVNPGDSTEKALSVFETMLIDAPPAARDGFDELISNQTSYAIVWHTYAGQVGFVVVARIVDDAGQHASANVLTLMGWLMVRGMTLVTPFPLTESEACVQFGDVI